MTNFFIYIGAEKTGTTSTQRLLYKLGEIEADGETYFAEKNTFLRPFARQETSSWRWDSGELSPNNSYICVSEFFFRDFSGRYAVRRLKAAMAPVTPMRIKLFVRVRDQASWLTSFWSTYLRQGGKMDLPEWVEIQLGKRESSLDWFDRVIPWEKSFGSRNLRVGEYIASESVLDFVWPRGATRVRPSLERLNRSLSLPAARELLVFNRTTPGDVNARKIFLRDLEGYGSGEVKISRKQRDDIGRRFSEQNRRANKRWGLNLPIS